LGQSLTKADLATREVVLRRLNRAEYEYTVRDLFDVHVDVQSVLPDDSSAQRFDTIGSELSLSAEHMLAYVQAADVLLDQAFGPPEAPRHVNTTINLKDLSVADTADRREADGVVLFSGVKHMPLYGVWVAGPYSYRRLSLVASRCRLPRARPVPGRYRDRRAARTLASREPSKIVGKR
jgi:hypothetical protein